MTEDGGDLIPDSWLDDDGDAAETDERGVAPDAAEETSATLAALAAAARTRQPDRGDGGRGGGDDEPTFELADLAGTAKSARPNPTPETTSQPAPKAESPKPRPSKSGPSKSGPSKSEPSKSEVATPTVGQAQAKAKDKANNRARDKDKDRDKDRAKANNQDSSTRATPAKPGRRDPVPKTAAPTRDGRSPSAVGGLRPLVLAALVVIALVAVVLVAWLLLRGGSGNATPAEPEAVDGITLTIDTCGLDGASATLSNSGAQAMEFDAGIDFVDTNDTPLYPVRIAVNLEAGASRSVQVPFGGAAPAGDIRCVGSLRNVTPMP